MIGPLPPAIDDPWDDGPFGAGTNNNAAAAAWRERERRARSVRLVMMFLLMMWLMDGEEQTARRRSHEHAVRKSKLYALKPRVILEKNVWEQRTDQDLLLQTATRTHSRFLELMELNHGRNVPDQVRHWAEKQEEADDGKNKQQQEDDYMLKSSQDDPEDRKMVYHYPWNATGSYFGEWIRDNNAIGEDGDDVDHHPVDTKKSPKTKQHDSSSSAKKKEETVQFISPIDAEGPMQEILALHKEPVGIYLLPPQLQVTMESNLTAAQLLAEEEAKTTKESRAVVRQHETSRGRGRGRGGAPLLFDSFLRGGDRGEQLVDSNDKPKLTLQKPSGQAALHFYSRSVPAMSELSLLDGFVQLCDSTTAGFPTRRDVLLRVKGVIFHSIGRISMVANVPHGRSALVISNAAESKIKKKNDAAKQEKTDKEVEENERRHRRLLEALSNLSDSGTEDNLEHIRDDALSLYQFDHTKDEPDNEWKMDSLKLENEAVEGEQRAMLSNLLSGWNNNDFKSSWIPSFLQHGRRLDTTEDEPDEATVHRHHPDETSESDDDIEEMEQIKTEELSPIEEESESFADVFAGSRRTEAREAKKAKTPTDEAKEKEPKAIIISKTVRPYPFVPDDKKESIQKAKTQASRRLRQRELLLEANAGQCEFELNFDVKEIEWTMGQWKHLVGRQVHETSQMDPSVPNKDADQEKHEVEPAKKKNLNTLKQRKQLLAERAHENERLRARLRANRDQALVMEIVGTIQSPNCQFSASINATAVRWDWEHITGKAINYSFYMMLTCLTQIVVLLRQLLHSQAQSAAIRVSLMCVGWQTVLDALMFLAHLSLSLQMQPVFTAFASVAFFKLLIFCVIEMKYMAIIMQARTNSGGGGQATTEVLRRQVAMLHLRFYVALMSVLMGFLYAASMGDYYRSLYIVALYSFWVPQIILNIVTEAKRPLHPYYVYGMSITRMVAPVYIFAVPNNFWKDAPYDPFLCQMLALWVGIQTAVLVAQGHYGARFMIPARFLPPKFDYSRPIPESLLPDGMVSSPQESSFGNEGSEVEVQTINDNSSSSDRHSTTRNRIKGNRLRSSSSTVQVSETTSTTSTTTTTTTTPTTTENNTNNNTSSSSEHGGTRPSSPNTGSSTLDCVICYNPIDVHNRRGYMLAPCDHVFHRDCLIQWMDVKMECPICRTELPSL